jgi:hypothetical protein
VKDLSSSVRDPLHALYYSCSLISSRLPHICGKLDGMNNHNPWLLVHNLTRNVIIYGIGGSSSH